MSEGHWIVNTVIAGHPMAFNMDTLVTMWAAMLFLIVVSFLVPENFLFSSMINRDLPLRKLSCHSHIPSFYLLKF